MSFDEGGSLNTTSNGPSGAQVFLIFSKGAPQERLLDFPPRVKLAITMYKKMPGEVLTKAPTGTVESH